MNHSRYHWRKPSDLPDRVELVDTISSRRVAVITKLHRTWAWKRDTTVLLHGAPPAEGSSTSLVQAKVRVLEGLPEE